MFNPKRLTLARKRQKLTAKKLAEKAGLTSVTLSRLETGLNKPEPSTITSLAKALGYPEDFFLGDDLDELTAEAVSFRSLTAMTAKERESAMAAGSFVYMLVDWISERFNLPELKFIDYSEERNPEAAARALREHWSLGESPIKNMVWLLESKVSVFFHCLKIHRMSMLFLVGEIIRHMCSLILLKRQNEVALMQRMSSAI